MVTGTTSDNAAKRGDFVKVIVISLVYCLVQIPNITSNTFQFSSASYNGSDYEVDATFPVILYQDMLPVFFYLSAVAVSSVAATLITFTGHYDLALLGFSILSVSRVFIGGSQDLLILSVLGTVAGVGFGGSFVTACLYLVLLSDNKKTGRNFSFFAACCGASYFLYAGVLGITNPCTVEPCRISSFVASLCGLLIMALLAVKNKCKSVTTEEKRLLYSKDSLDFINGTLRYKQHISTCSVLEVSVAVLFYTYSCELLSMMFAHCLLITGVYEYHAEALIPYGIGFMLSSLQWSYYYKHWTSSIRTVISTIFLVTGLTLTLTFKHDACASPELLESWYMVPFVALLTGQGLGSVTCETYTVLNIAWTSRMKFTVLLLIQTAWTLCFSVLNRTVTVTLHISILASLGMMYCISIMNFQRRAKRFYQRMNSYLAKGTSLGLGKNSGSKYGATHV